MCRQFLKKKKKPVILRLVSAIVVALICLLFGTYVWIGRDVRKNISLAQQQYPGSAESSLISFLLDDNNSTTDRTHLAIWTLGQVRSEKALPDLYQYYNNDPHGHTCYGRHDAQLCQYEIHKTIAAIKKGRVFSYARFK
jgi:hypothetical protein